MNRALRKMAVSIKDLADALYQHCNLSVGNAELNQEHDKPGGIKDLIKSVSRRMSGLLK